MSYSDFANGYMECLLWSSLHYADETSDPIPFDEVDAILAPEAIAEIEQDLQSFYTHESSSWQAAGMSDEQAGHDFALTRNGHGAGFWDRGLGSVGDELTKACKPYGPCEPYLGDDGRIYI